MANPGPHLSALAGAASDSQRTLESSIATVDGSWHDGTRRTFEAEHLAVIRADARHLRVELAEIARAAEQALRLLSRS